MFDFLVFVKCPYCKKTVDLNVTYDASLEPDIDTHSCPHCRQEFVVEPNKLEASALTFKLEDKGMIH